MKFKDFIKMYDCWSGTTVVNDDDLNCILKDVTWNIVREEHEVLNMEVVSFGFYDDELCVRVR